MAVQIALQYTNFQYALKLCASYLYWALNTIAEQIAALGRNELYEHVYKYLYVYEPKRCDT